MEANMAYTIYTRGVVSNFPEKGDVKLGFWCYYLRTINHTELKCEVVDSKTTTPRMQLKAVIEALKACKNIGPQNTVKVYTTDQQYFDNCFNDKANRRKNKDLWEEIDNLQIDKQLMMFPADKDNSIEESRGMRILKSALKDTQEYDSNWQGAKSQPNMEKYFGV